MKNHDLVKRAIAFYLALALFFMLLPVVLSYSLGYKIDFKKFRIYKTGIIYLKSNPTGAYISINGKQHYDITPTRIEEMKPGEYDVEVRRDGFYPWQARILVKPNMVTRIDDIVLFPVPRHMNKVAEYEVKDLAISEKGSIYYMTKNGLFRSNMDGTNVRKLSAYSDWPDIIKGKKFSWDGEKILYFNENRVWVVYLNVDKDLRRDGQSAKVEEILNSLNPILDLFWYSGSNYIVCVTSREVNVIKLEGEGIGSAVTMYRFSERPKYLYYDEDNDSLYFTDLEKSGRSYLYRLDLREKFFDQLMRRLRKEFEAKIE